MYSKGFLTAKYLEEVDPLYATLQILKNAFENTNQNLLDQQPATNCSTIGLNWNTGRVLYKY